MTTLTHHEPQTSQDILQLNGTDYVEFYVGNARQASYFYRMAMGFSLVLTPAPRRASATVPPTFCNRARSALC